MADLLAVWADALGGYRRLICPHPGCWVSVRYRRLPADEVERFRGWMAEHARTHPKPV